MKTTSPTAQASEKYSLIKLHRYAGLTLATFIGIHICNHLAGLISVEAHISIMNIARLVYRNPIGEFILLLAVIVQIPSGILLVRKKGWRGIRAIEKVQVASGLYLAFFLIAHIFAVMMGRFYFKLDTNFYFGSSPLFSPFWWYYVGYYGLSVVAVFAHVASIHFQKMENRISLQRSQMQAWSIGIIGVIVSVLILLLIAGKVHEITIPAAYKWW